jgi:hypothetical protein
MKKEQFKQVIKLIRRFLTLNPYGNNLRSPQTTFWFISAGIIIALMAFSEGFVWANLFNFFFSETLSKEVRIPLCLGIGIVIFWLLWLIDTTFVLLDNSTPPLLEMPTGRFKAIKTFVKQHLNKNAGKFWLGFVTRIVVVALSLYITIPAITKLSISEDIDKSIKDDNNKIRTAKVDSITNNIDKINAPKLAQLDSIIELERSDLKLEVAGKGKSGKYGYKDAAQAIEKSLNAHIAERNSLEKKINTEKSIVENASDNQLSKKYGVEFKKKTAGVVNEVAEKLSKNQNYKEVEGVARTYVILLFVALVLLKIFAPRSVKIYLNEELQDLYKAFKTNQINSIYFAYFKDEFDNTKEITPYRFYEFWEKYYFKYRYDFMKQLENDENLKQLDLKIAKFNQQKSDIEKELKPYQDEFIQEMEKLLSLEDKKNKLTLQTENNSNKITEITNEINTIKSSKSDIRAEYLSELSKTQNNLIKEKEELQVSLKTVANEIYITTKQIEFAQNKINTINKSLNTLQNNLDRITELKGTLRNKYLDTLQ